MLNRKRTKSILRSKYLMFFPMIALLIFFGNCTNKAATEQSQSHNYIDDSTTDVVSPKATPVVSAEPSINGLDTVFTMVEVMPEFPDGTKALIKYLSENMKYPADAEMSRTQGRVIAQFIVNKDGSICDVKIVRGVYESLDNEALRLIKEMPKWKPGMEKGEVVRVKYTVPVVFRLK